MSKIIISCQWMIMNSWPFRERMIADSTAYVMMLYFALIRGPMFDTYSFRALFRYRNVFYSAYRAQGRGLAPSRYDLYYVAEIAPPVVYALDPLHSIFWSLSIPLCRIGNYPFYLFSFDTGRLTSGLIMMLSPQLKSTHLSLDAFLSWYCRTTKTVRTYARNYITRTLCIHRW